MSRLKAVLMAVVLLSPADPALSAVGQQVQHKWTWLMDNVEVKGIVRWIDPKDTTVEPPTEAGGFGVEPDPNYRHLIDVMPGNNPLLFQPPGSIGTLFLETYPLEQGNVNRHEHWNLPRKPDDIPFEIMNPATGVKRPLAVGDHVRVVGRWVIDHHPEWCDICNENNPPTWCATVNPKPFRCHNRGLLRTGLAHVELHPFRWNDMQLVVPEVELANNAAFEILSLAAPLHEELYHGNWKWAANELAGVAGKIFISSDGSNYHSTMIASANIKAPALPSDFAGDPALVAYQENVIVNGTGLDVSGVRSVTLTHDGILVNAKIDAPRTLSSGGVTFADMNDPAKGKSIFQASYMVYWLRRLRIIDQNGVPYETDNPFDPATIQLPLTAIGPMPFPFLVYAQTRGPSPVVIKSVTIENDPEGVFAMAPVKDLAVPSGFAADLGGAFKPSHTGTFNAKVVILSNDPSNARLEIRIQGKAVQLQEIP